MNVSWLFFDKKEIWAKCKECGRWNKIREKTDIARFKPSPEKPIKEICQNADCRKELVI